MIVDKDQIDPYLKGDADLIPLHPWNKQSKNKNGKTQERGKTPLFPNWTKDIGYNKKNVDKVMRLAEKGFNIGYRIGAEDFIIDVDPRNFEEDRDSLAELCGFLGVIDLADSCPTVLTGGGGYHYYMHVSVEEGTHIRETIEQFPGIEFKTIGRQVVAAGSKHPNSNYYIWDDFSPLYGEQPVVDAKLLSLLTYTVSESSGATNLNPLTLEELAKLLDQIPVEHYSDNDNWFKILCAAHHGTNGLGLEEFLAWSLDDISYSDDEHLIRCRWASLGEKNISITINTVYKEVLKHGGSTNVTSATDEFEDFADDISDSDIDPGDDINPGDKEESIKITKSLEDMKNSGEHSSLDNIDKDDKETIEIAKSLIKELHPSCETSEIVKAVRSVLQVKCIVTSGRLLEDLRAKLKMTSGSFNKMVKGIKQEISDSIDQDLCRVIAELTYDVAFYHGEGLIYSVGEQFWQYNGKYWQVITKKYLELKVSKIIDKLREKMKIDRSENSLVIEASHILGRIAAVNHDKLGLTKRPKPIVNCKNGELWISKDGSVDLKEHRAKSYLLQVLPVKYDKSADCPKFEAMLKRTFSRFEDTDEIVSFIYEMIGYIIQPNKDLEKWFMFYGSGGDGKSTLIRIISALLGKSVLPESINMFANDNHIMSDVPGKLLITDDDMDRNTKLPDGTLKKLCGRNDLNANPKGAKTERFSPATTLILSCNGLPRTDDLSEGGRRRPIVVPFNNKFHIEGGGGVLDMAEQVMKEELAGVLNKAIKGLQRLRDRGRFDEPLSCAKAKKIWIAESNMTAMFVSERLELSGDDSDKVTLGDMYGEFSSWCDSNQIRYVTGKIHFKQNMIDLGLRFGVLHGNKRGFKGVKVLDLYGGTGDFDEFEDD